MDKKLINEIARLRAINNYCNIQEGYNYQFYDKINEAGDDQQTDVNINLPGEEGNEPPMGDEPPMGNDDGMGNEPPTGNDDGMGVDIEEPISDNPDDENMGNSDDIGGDDTIEVDITDLVNNSNEMKEKIVNLSGNIEKIQQVLNSVNDINNKLANMDRISQELSNVAYQVELMRPPTEKERKEVLKKDSYPFNISVDEYNNQNKQTQTDLEKKSSSDILKNIMNKYNEMDIKKSFNAPHENPFDNNELNNL